MGHCVNVRDDAKQKDLRDGALVPGAVPRSAHADLLLFVITV